ncbi:MAG: toprim domain-containing protein [Desulfobacterales bacterium]|nr:toprim domain-containing protein [Pseudomonadota bacterium]MBU4357176.1 toprim domain-containing protein [Pseudomonadota bacterium]MCG2771384.1 toprim domain-containing protein [Desulfobacterales bacterium]
MNDLSFLERLADRLRSSEHKSPHFKDNGQSMSNLICPECGDKTAWAYTKAPWSINCNRLNKCGAKTKTLDLFPDLILNIEKEFAYSPEDPNRPATAYLNRRGLHESSNGLNYRFMANIRGSGSGAVMFPVGKDSKGDTIYNGRLFNPPAGVGKTHNIGSTAGVLWRHPGIEYDSEKEIFLTEGIINALSLIELGHQAIAVLSAGQDPAKLDLSEFKKLVFAFDSDEAGKKALKKWMKQYPTANAVFPLKGDWNDLLTSLPKEKAQSFFLEKRLEFEVMAKLALAKSAYEYAKIFDEFYNRSPDIFEFGGCYYFAFYKDVKGERYLKTIRVSNFTIGVDHYQLDTSNSEEPVNKFYLNINPQKGRSTSCVVTAQELASSQGLTTMFMQRARGLWEGDRPASLALARMIVEAGAPVVRQLQTVGYDPESGCYVFKHFLINPKGDFLTPNKHGFFDVSRAISIRPAPHPTLNPIKGITPKEIWLLIYLAWGPKGITALAWVVAGWWVNQIKAQIGFFPFLSLWKDPQTGKTRLTRILNALQGLDEEGLPMTKVNTGKGEIRKLAQRSGLFKALLEANNADRAKFEIETILPLYNVNPLQTTATKTLDIQTREVPFLASLMFVQNKEPFKTKPQKERVISLQFLKEEITPKTSEAFHSLIKKPLPELAYFIVIIMSQRQQIESGWHIEFLKAKKELYETIPDNRLNENYALILAFHRLLCALLGVNYDLKPYIEDIGQKKYEECNQRNETIADYFFNLLLGNEINEDKEDPCYKIIENQHQIYIHLGKAIMAIEKKGLPLKVQLKDLQGSLQDHPSFIQSNAGRQLGGTYTKVWIFDLQKIVEEV